MCRRFLLGKAREAHDGQAVANFPEVRGGAIEFNHSLSRRALNRIGLEPLAIAQVSYEDFFVGEQTNQLGQIHGDREAAFVIETRSRDGGAMDFGFEKRQFHR